MNGYWVSKVRALSGVERRTLAISLVLLPLVGLGLRVFGYKRTQQALARISPRKAAESDVRDQVEQARIIARSVRIAARRGLYRATCLRESLTLWWLLRRRGIISDLRLGVDKQSEAFNAHAWIEVAGIPVNDAIDVAQRFRPMVG